MWAKRTERLITEGGSRTRQEARRLEDKVAKVAAKKCSVEEVSLLHKELEDWLMTEVKDDKVCHSICRLPPLLCLYILFSFVDFPLSQCGVAAGHPHESSGPLRSQ